jgi:hypothetical protein
MSPCGISNLSSISGGCPEHGARTSPDPVFTSINIQAVETLNTFSIALRRKHDVSLTHKCTSRHKKVLRIAAHNYCSPDMRNVVIISALSNFIVPRVAT